MGSGPSDPTADDTTRPDRQGLDQVGALLERASLATVHLTTAGEIRRVNDAFETLSGYDRSALLGESLETFLTDEGAWLERLDSTRDDDHSTPVTSTHSIRTAAGDVVSCDWHLARLEGGDSHESTHLTIVDPSEATPEMDPLTGGTTTADESTSGGTETADIRYGKTFAALAEALPDGIIVLDTNSDVQYANPAVERILGYEPEELVGDSKVKIIPDRLRETHLTALQRYLETGEKHINWTYVELPGQHRDGYEVPLGVSLNEFFYDGDRYFVGLFRDVSPRKRAERELAAKAAQQEAVAYLGQHALETADVDDLLEKAAELTAAAMGVDHCDVLDVRGGSNTPTEDEHMRLLVRAGVGWDECVVGSEFASEDATASLASYTLDADEPVVVEDLEADPRLEDSSLLTDHGVRSAISVPIGPSTDPWGILGVHDTDRREFAEHDVAFVRSVATVLASSIERTRYETRLTETVADLEESNDHLEQFASVVSHDVQEPLRMISSYLQLLENRYSDDLDDDGREFLAFAVDGADRLQAMIEGLLAYSRVDTDAGSFEPTDLERIVERVRSNLQIRIDETDADFVVGELPTVVGDPSQLEQLFQNLVSNAITYRGGEPPRIEIDAERRDGEWRVHVSDEGIGIDPEETDRIFDVFQRLHAQEYDGTGIGLAICAKIVDRHDGRIQVDSEPGEGSTFTVAIPVRSDERVR